MMWFRVCVGVSVVGLGALVPGLALSRSSGAPAGFAGEIRTSGERSTCVVCHSGNAVNDPLGGGSVTIDAPDTAVPGETLTITVTLVNNTPETTAGRRQGFLTTVRNPADSLFVGSFTVPDPANVRLTDSNDEYVTHTTAGTGQTSWSFQWTAPTTDVPSEVVMYTAGNAANGSGLGGDFIYTDTHTVSLTSVASEEGPAERGGVEWEPVSPNPLRASARAELVLDAPMHVEVHLVDGRGRRIRTLASGMRPSGSSEVEVDVRGLAPGPYFLVAETEAGNRTQAVSVVR